MTIKINIDGYEVTVSDPAEAAALLHALKKQPEKPVIPAIHEQRVAIETPAVPMIEDQPRGADFDSEAALTALRFLKTVRDGQANGGVQSNAIMSALGVTKPKAIGSKSASINKLIKSLGFSVSAVYVNPRSPDIGRIWKPRRNMAQAIAQIEQRLAAH